MKARARTDSGCGAGARVADGLRHHTPLLTRGVASASRLAPARPAARPPFTRAAARRPPRGALLGDVGARARERGRQPAIGREELYRVLLAVDLALRLVASALKRLGRARAGIRAARGRLERLRRVCLESEMARVRGIYVEQRQREAPPVNGAHTLGLLRERSHRRSARA